MPRQMPVRPLWHSAGLRPSRILAHRPPALRTLCPVGRRRGRAAVLGRVFHDRARSAIWPQPRAVSARLCLQSSERQAYERPSSRGAHRACSSGRQTRRTARARA
eukprot:scaffold166358_cov23-Tisochrysis_lutea.AAC.3